MKVSVIIPTYNEEKVILDCLESLGKQTLADFEIIVVDDGSKDKTLRLVRNLTKLTNIKLITQEHKGAGAARNLGAKHATGDVLVFVDADMTFDEEFIAKLTEPIEKGTTIGTFSKNEMLENRSNPWARSWNINRGLPEDRMHSSNYPDTQKVFRAILKSKFEEAGGFDEKGGYADDGTLAERLNTLATNAKGAIFYHKNPDSLKEVFDQSRWMAKRKYKLGVLSIIPVLLRVSLPASIIVGVYKALKHKLPQFLIFKIVSDFACLLGILEYSLLGKVSK